MTTSKGSREIVFCIIAILCTDAAILTSAKIFYSLYFEKDHDWTFLIFRRRLCWKYMRLNMVTKELNNSFGWTKIWCCAPTKVCQVQISKCLYWNLLRSVLVSYRYSSLKNQTHDKFQQKKNRVLVSFPFVAPLSSCAPLHRTRGSPSWNPEKTFRSCWKKTSDHPEIQKKTSDHAGR